MKEASRKPDYRAETVPHPSVFIQEEMDARGWDRDTLAHRMGGDFGVNRLALDFYFEVGPTEPNMLLGSGEDFAKAFGVSAAFFLNLEWLWRRAQTSLLGQPKAI